MGAGGKWAISKSPRLRPFCHGKLPNTHPGHESFTVRFFIIGLLGGTRDQREDFARTIPVVRIGLHQHSGAYHNCKIRVACVDNAIEVLHWAQWDPSSSSSPLDPRSMTKKSGYFVLALMSASYSICPRFPTRHMVCLRRRNFEDLER